MKKIGVSYLGVKSIPKTLVMIDKTDADYVHVDVMDGKYTDYKTVGINEKAIGKYTRKRLDVHLMVRKPLKYIDDFADLNVDCINIHVDTKNDTQEVIDRIKLFLCLAFFSIFSLKISLSSKFILSPFKVCLINLVLSYFISYNHNFYKIHL